jgi:hypothetical protein
MGVSVRVGEGVTGGVDLTPVPSPTGRGGVCGAHEARKRLRVRSRLSVRVKRGMGNLHEIRVGRSSKL